MSKIIYADYYMPSNTVSVKNILLNSKAFLATNSSTNINEAVNKYIRDTGLSEITIEKDGDITDIFSGMLTKMFEKMDIAPEKIKNIFYTSYENYDYNDRVSVPYYLQIKYKLFNAAVMTLHQYCSSTLQAIRMADSLNKNEKGGYSLIISPSFLGESEDRYVDITVMGDGAAIMLVGDDCNEGFKIIDTFSISDGYISYYCYENPKKSEKNKYDELKIKLIIFESLRKAIKKTIEIHENWFTDAKLVIVQNISINFIKEYSKNLGRFYANYYGGHIGDVDITRNLKDLMDSAKFEKGDKIILFGLGGDCKCTNATSVLCQYE